MNVPELYSLTRWIDREIKQGQIMERYSALQEILARNAQPNQEKQPFEQEKEQLLDASRRVALESLTQEQVDFLTDLGIGEHVGSAAIENVEGVLFRNAIDPATAASTIQSAIESIRAGVSRSDQLKAGLDGLVDEPDPLEEGILIRVTFGGAANIEHVVDLKNWAATWHTIARGFAMVHDAAPEDIKVVGAGRGSVVIELAVYAFAIAQTISGVLLAALKVADRVMDIRIKAEDLKGMKLRNKKLASELEAEAKEEEERGAEEIAGQVATSLKLGDSDGEKQQVLEKSVKELVAFLRKGGKVDYVLPLRSEDSDEDDQDDKGRKRAAKEIEDLRKTLEEIRTLEQSVKELEAGSNNNSADDEHEDPN